MKRNFKEKAYVEWRKGVLKRDGYCCKICNSKKRLQTHHIRGWEAFPTLRYIISNGITLCKICHQRMWSKEENFAAYCYTLINPDSSSIHDILRDYEERE